jgi:RND family efflux transporter MFP subunit
MNKNKLYLLLLVIALVIVVWFWAGRRRPAPATGGADSGGAPAAAVAPVTHRDLSKEITVTAEFRPYEEVELHAKVSGYVKEIKVDFGDRVKAGELLATLEVPELQAELVNAQAIEQKAEADYTNMHVIHTRLVAVNQSHPNLVAEQDLDTAAANEQTASAAIAAAQADVVKYQTLVKYTKITAPFDGVVTRRYADPGTLIQAGTASDTQSLPVVRVSDNYRLRLDFPVTVDYAKDMVVGDPVTVRVDSLNNRTFTGKISRFTHDVDEATRTMITEIEVPNPDLKLIPGMYATVELKVEKRPGVLAIPTQAVTGDKGDSVLVVNAQHEIEEHHVTLGLETADAYEVLSGLQAGDLVVVGNFAGFQPGEKVEPKVTQLSARE